MNVFCVLPINFIHIINESRCCYQLQYAAHNADFVKIPAKIVTVNGGCDDPYD